MPILRQHNMLEFNRKVMNRLNHRIAIAHRQRPARAEIILHIDDNQHVVAGDFTEGHYGLNSHL
jgi:hypothetical protein